MKRLAHLANKHKRHVALLVVLGMFALLALVAGCWFAIRPSGKYVMDYSTVKQRNVRVGLVLGGGVDILGRPHKELRGRLDVAAEALRRGVVQKLILSGDNRFENYNEPVAMYDYLVDEQHIDGNKLEPDFAGRSTYESCERAKKIFSQDRLVLISARSHLPRAIFLCRKMGIEAYGLPTEVESNNNFRRELLARVKAIINIYIVGERTVLGDKIKI